MSTDGLFFFLVSSFYCQYLVSFQAYVLVKTLRRLNRCSDKKVILFNAQYIAALLGEYGHFSFIHFFFNNFGSKLSAGLHWTYPPNRFNFAFDMFHILHSWENPCRSEATVSLLFMRSLVQTFTNVTSNYHKSISGNVSRHLPTHQTLSRLVFAKVGKCSV